MVSRVDGAAPGSRRSGARVARAAASRVSRLDQPASTAARSRLPSIAGSTARATGASGTGSWCRLVVAGAPAAASARACASARRSDAPVFRRPGRIAMGADLPAMRASAMLRWAAGIAIPPVHSDREQSRVVSRTGPCPAPVWRSTRGVAARQAPVAPGGAGRRRSRVARAASPRRSREARQTGRCGR